MRIIAGRWAGRDLVSPAGRVRPTTEALRDACMAMLADSLRAARVLDLFAGSGALGLEALSRGAASCDFVENGPPALHALKANVASLRARDRARIYDRDAIPFVERISEMRYDVAFADPPYGSKKLDRVLGHWKELPFSRILAVEHAADTALPGCVRSRRVGASAISVFERTSAGPADPSTR